MKQPPATLAEYRALCEAFEAAARREIDRVAPLLAAETDAHMCEVSLGQVARRLLDVLDGEAAEH